MKEEAHFLDALSSEFIVRSLTLDIATLYAERLVEIHNGIPNQRWTRGELLADRDSRREFKGKWEISTYTSRLSSPVPIGFCIGFETDRTTHFPEAGVYMHRSAVLESERGVGIGGIMHVETMVRIFDRPLRYVGASNLSVFPAYGQTSKEDWNRRMLDFWLEAGFELIGEKPYPDRIDHVMRMTRSSLTRSRHYRLWQRVRTSTT